MYILQCADVLDKLRHKTDGVDCCDLGLTFQHSVLAQGMPFTFSYAKNPGKRLVRAWRSGRNYPPASVQTSSSRSDIAFAYTLSDTMALRIGQILRGNNWNYRLVETLGNRHVYSDVYKAELVPRGSSRLPGKWFVNMQLNPLT